MPSVTGFRPPPCPPPPKSSPAVSNLLCLYQLKLSMKNCFDSEQLIAFFCQKSFDLQKLVKFSSQLF